MFGSLSKLRKVKQQIESGKLDEATALFLQSHGQAARGGAELARRLAQTLMARAQTHSIRSNYAEAWDDLAHAERLFDAIGQGMPEQLLRQKQELVELVIESAEGHLLAGRPWQAVRSVAELRRRHILDSRADQIESIARRVQVADQFAHQGQWARADDEFDRILAQRPDLSWIQTRRQALAQQSATAGGLTHRLQTAMQESRWSTARKVSSQLLAIAPHLQIAADALRRSIKRNVPPVVEPAPLKTPIQPSLHDTAARYLTETDIPEASSSSAHMKRFMLWVDGVGGYLLIVDPVAVIGRALPDAGIEIPIQGDLRRRHLRIERRGTDYLASALAEASTNGRPITDPQVLRSGQRVLLGSSVHFEFVQPHPLSITARLHVTSRHRTQPWSDGVLLVSDTLILGASSAAHIVCPELEGELVMVYRQGTWSIRGGRNLEVDGKVLPDSGEIVENCRITSDGISMSLEAI